MSNPKFKDLTGKIYGRLTVVSRASNRKGKSWWVCICVCGKTKEVSAVNLNRGSVTSCGCYQKESASQRRRSEFECLLGQKFNSLLVVSSTRNEKTNRLKWVCLCDCGNYHITDKRSLKAGTIKTCGCGPKGPARPNLLGKVYDRLTVIEELPHYYGNSGGSAWVVKCTCGTTKIMPTGSLVSGANKSCGCYKRELGTTRLNEYIKTHQNELHPQWNPELSDKERNSRRDKIENEWAKEVKERDNYICQVCNQRGGKLHSHHLDSYREHPEKRTELSNGITLCKDCHKAFHKKYGSRKATYEWQFQEFKSSHLNT